MEQEFNKQPITMADAFNEFNNKFNLVNIREMKSESYGSREECENLFKSLFTSLDKTVKDFEWLEEYNQVVDWMVNTNGKGLCLTGGCGRGKSVILCAILPVLIHIKDRKLVRPLQAQDLPTYYEGFIKRNTYIIDDIGTEIKCNDYGRHFEGFNNVMNVVENRMRKMYLSTNLNIDELIDRYGERTVERIVRNCKVIEFIGDSLRK